MIQIIKANKIIKTAKVNNSLRAKNIGFWL